MRALVFLAVAGAVNFNCGEAWGDEPAFAWGVCGHPTWSDYAEWVPENVTRQIADVRELGCTYYRCSFEGGAGPDILHSIVPVAEAAGITVLPDLPLKIVAHDDAKTNYDTNYLIGSKWAGFAIAHKYRLPYWELANEIENWNLVKVVYDGTAPDEFPDKTPGGFAAIVASLNGAYHGIKDTYAAARSRGDTDITPRILYGCCYHHWGLLTKIEQANGGLPCDIISWHWYEPNCGMFVAPIHDAKSSCNGRSPAECLAEFKSHEDPAKPMDVWITELNRSVKTPAGYLNGSVSDSGPQGQDWPAEAQEIGVAIEDVKHAPNVKAIFVYELFDETLADRSDPKRLRSEGSFGLMTGLTGKHKDAFYTYQNEIKENH